MIESFADVSFFGDFMRDFWNLLPPIIRLLITAVFAMLLVFGMLKLID